MHGITPFHDFHGFRGRNPQMFDPFSHHCACNNFPFEFPFRAPFMMPPPFLLSNMHMQPHMSRSKIEYKETPEAHLFTAELPGMKREDVNVHVDEAKVLHISAQNKHEKEEKEENYHHMERGFGEFVSTFKLPPNSKPENIRTCVENGFLTVTVPKERVDHEVEIQHQNQYNY